ncbi:MAG: hypothetical protein AVDCRST_MAG10-1934 [uncultured Acidimicrobiales bacterium]|uniref:Uncharacterized protein n=1 Tax=uncultured Acidimicrobiales bacterium TaxID=310071 RepID=A0A6J4IBB4_9ACTN|nr:MAG: hypothetical protein AVDCRST_MAG10-1934 [uncultured Acidimicrobiales bacterium]
MTASSLPSRRATALGSPLELDVEPQGAVEQIGEKLGFVSKQAEGDLKRFAEFIESRGAETGA